MDVGDGGQVEFGPVLGWRRLGGTNRMYLFFCPLFFSFVWRTWGEGVWDASL